MSHELKSFFWSAGMMAATTIGAGIFSLPYVFAHAGMLAGIFYLAALSGLLIASHNLYWEVLEKVHERKRLLGLTKTYLGGAASRFGFLVIVGGLILALVVYLILGGEFLALLFPSVGGGGTVLFWLIASLPLLLKLKRLVASELLGGVVMLAAILLIFFGAPQFSNLTAGARPVAWGEIFLPFGPVLFSLAGWTAVEPIFDSNRRHGKRAMAWGTIAAALLYLLFVIGIFGGAESITEDTISGLVNWPSWKLGIILILGLFAIWTSYVPISLEIKNALEKDLKWPHAASVAIIFFVPPILLLLGLRDFLSAIGLAGGVFLGLQYLLIALIARRALALNSMKRFFVQAVAALFLLAAVYEVYYFVAG